MAEINYDEEAKKFMRLLGRVEFSGGDNGYPSLSLTMTTRDLITSLAGRGLLADLTITDKETPIFLIRYKSHGGPALFIESLHTEIRFSNLEFAKACRKHFGEFNQHEPNPENNFQILQLVEP